MYLIFKNKKVVIIGGNGGLGQVYMEMFQKEGAITYIGARNLDKIPASYTGFKGYIDINCYKSIEAFVSDVKRQFESVDYVINATGYDVRKSLNAHTEYDIENCININLRGTVFLSKAFLKIMKEVRGSTIVHMGGFIDGGLAFPYYSVDVATRSGMFAFIKAMNRELKQENSQVRFTYFCPDPADTLAEKPYHPIWKEMRTKIRTKEEVAIALKKVLVKQKNVSYMGGRIQSIFTKINHISPKLSDFLLMNQYSRILKRYLG